MSEQVNHEIPKKGDLVKLKSGIVTTVLNVIGEDRWGKVEVMVGGARGYADIEDLEVLNALDRLVKEL